MGSWLKAHRKQVLAHATIMVAFLLLVIFVAEPLFDRLEAIPGEAQLQRLDLPSEDGAMRSHIDDLTTEDGARVEIRGWAYIEGEDSEGSEVYIVLKSGRRTYIFDSMVQVRRDVTRYFQELNLNLDYAGFVTSLPGRNIADGEYTIGIYIRKGDIEALRYTSRGITKSGGTIEVTG